MSTFQRLSLIGLYNYDDSIFAELVMPGAYDIALFRDAVLLEHGEKTVLYTNPEFMKKSIGAWGRKWYANLERIAAALEAEYNPLWNYDRHELTNEVTDSQRDITFDGNSDSSGTAKDTPNFSTAHNRTSDRTETRTDEVSADNSTGYQPEHKTTVNVSGDNNTDVTSGTAQDLATTGNVKTDDRTDDDLLSKFGRDSHIWGNVGTTKSQEMVEDEVLLREKYNLYDIAGRIFASELLINIW